jgi:type IV secretion system protein VirD4
MGLHLHLTVLARVALALATGLMLLAVAIAAARSGRRAGAAALVWRVRLRLRPGPGFAAGRWVLWRRHGLPAVRRTAGRTRPGLGPRARRARSWREYATFVGWAQGWVAPLRVYAGFEQLLLVIAPPQKGKSAAAAGRILDDPGPVVATSIRDDLIAATAGLRQQAGQVHVFNPEAAGRYRSTVRWDPVAGCQDMATAVRRAGYMVEAITGRGLEDATFWQDQASLTLAALLHAAALAAGSMREVYQWALEHSGQPWQILTAHPAAAPAAAEQVGHYLSLPGRTRSGVSTTLQVVLRFMQVPEIASMVCPAPGEGIDIPAFLRSRDTLYLVASDAAHSPVPPVFAALTAELAWQARITGAASPAGRLDPPLTLELDEPYNIAPVPLASWATWVAGSGIRMHVYAQAFAQLAERWGPLGAETIWQACDVKVIYAATAEEALCRKVEEACGHVRVRSAPDRQGKGTWEDRLVLPFELVRQLPPGRAVVIRGSAAPVIVRTEQYWRRRDVRQFARRGGQPVLPPASAQPAAEAIPELLAGSPAAGPFAGELTAGPGPRTLPAPGIGADPLTGYPQASKEPAQ